MTAQPFVWDGKTLDTVGAIFDAVVTAGRAGRAQEFLAAYRLANPAADTNVGYVIGYADADTRREMYAAYDVGHPVTGTPV